MFDPNIALHRLLQETKNIIINECIAILNEMSQIDLQSQDFNNMAKSLDYIISLLYLLASADIEASGYDIPDKSNQ